MDEAKVPKVTLGDYVTVSVLADPKRPNGKYIQKRVRIVDDPNMRQWIVETDDGTRFRIDK